MHFSILIPFCYVMQLHTFLFCAMRNKTCHAAKKTPTKPPCHMYGSLEKDKSLTGLARISSISGRTPTNIWSYTSSTVLTVANSFKKKHTVLKQNSTKYLLFLIPIAISFFPFPCKKTF